MNKKFIVTNIFEQSLLNIKNGQIVLDEFIKIFLESELILPSAILAQDNGSIVPIFFNKEKERMLSVFTSTPLLDIYKDNVKSYLRLKGKEILVQIPSGVGLVINPGYSLGFDISSEGIRNIIHDFLDCGDGKSWK